MKIVGCDLHTRYQQVAMLDEETGELVERRLEHESGEARAFYTELGRLAQVSAGQSIDRVLVFVCTLRSGGAPGLAGFETWGLCTVGIMSFKPLVVGSSASVLATH
jgi:hypothetical protein